MGLDGINSNEITLEDCVFLYYEGRRVVAEDGMITAIGHIHDCIGLKQNEAELHKLDVIDKIESKYGIEITDEKLTMRGDR